MAGGILAVDLVLRAVSAALLLAVFGTERKGKAWAVLGAVCLGYGGGLLAVHKVLIGRLNFLYFLRDILTRGVSYQELGFLTTSVLACGIGAFGAGWLASVLLRVPMCRGARQRNRALLFACILGLGAVASYYVSFTGREQLRLNEVSAMEIVSNEARTGDYIELYNGGFLGNSLSGLYLSDREDNLQKQALANGMLPAGQVLLVHPEGFGLRAEGGETVYLSDKDGRILDSVTTVQAPWGQAYGRSPDGAEEWTLQTATPGLRNREGGESLVRPCLSAPQGFYDSPFYLELSADSDLPVYYTLDCSIPTLDSPRYEEPIYVYDRSPEENVYRNMDQLIRGWEDASYSTAPVDKAFVVRAAVIDPEGRSGPVVTATYFIDKADYEDRMVISLVSGPEGLFGDAGICVTGPAYDAWYTGDRQGNPPQANFEQHGTDWERAADLSWFSPEKTGQQSVGMRIQGASTRLGLRLKRFSIYARKEYSGSSYLDLEPVPGIKTHSVVTRAASINTPANTLGMIFGRGLAVAREEFVQASIFLDGEFWYNASVLEKYDSHYFEQHYGISPENLVVVKGAELSEGQPEDMALRQEVNTFLETHDLADPENFSAFCTMVDLESYMDFMALNIYMDNLDFNENKNIIWWRSREAVEGNPYADGRWRFGLYDMDYLDWRDAGYFSLGSTAEKNTFALAGRTNGGPIRDQLLFSSLCRSPEFCRRFVLRFQHIANIRFSQESWRSALEEYEFPYLGYYIGFFKNRGPYIMEHLGEEFGLTGSLAALRVSLNDGKAGTVLAGDLEIPFSQDGTWTGTYYTDYPVTLTAVPAEGFAFAGWSTGEREPTLTLTLEEGGAEVYAVFEPCG